MKRFISLHCFVALFFISNSCNQNNPNWLTDLNHVISPDGKAILYQTSYKVDSVFQTSAATWITTPIATGGSGIFDIQSATPVPLTLSWTNDSTVLIQYDSAGEVLRMETETYFSGRKTKIMYETTQNREK